MTLRSAQELGGFVLTGVDEDVGWARDLLFDDRRWRVRWLVADSGKWISGPRALISPKRLEDPDWVAKRLPVQLTRSGLEGAPTPEDDPPVSRALHATTVVEPLPPADPHLRSAREVIGYRIEAEDGEAGRLADLLIDDEKWQVRALVVDTRSWLPGGRVTVPTDRRWRFDASKQEARVDLSRAAVEASPEYRPTRPIHRAYDLDMFERHGRTGYTDHWKEAGPTAPDIHTN